MRRNQFAFFRMRGRKGVPEPVSSLLPSGSLSFSCSRHSFRQSFASRLSRCARIASNPSNRDSRRRTASPEKSSSTLTPAFQ